MRIKPLYIYEFDSLDKNSYKRYIITNNVKDLFTNIFLIHDSYSFCLTENVAKEYFPKYIYKENSSLRIFTNSFLHLKKLTYNETIRYINLEVICDFDKVIKELINITVLFWDDWN